MLYWLIKRVLVGPPLRAVFRPTVEGLENVPVDGPAILAINHLSYSDWLFVPLVIDRRVTFVAKSEYFTTPGIKGRLQKSFFSGAGQVPIDRTSATAAAGALKTALRILDEGEIFAIFPEGTRSPDGRLYKGKTGVARIALESGVPVIPVGLMDTDTVAPPGQKFGRYAQPHIRFGKPMDFSRFEGMSGDRFVLRSITDEITYELMLLSGQEYVDEYASSRKKGVAAKARELGEGAATLAKDISTSASALVEDAAARIQNLGGDEKDEKSEKDASKGAAAGKEIKANASDQEGTGDLNEDDDDAVTVVVAPKDSDDVTVSVIEDASASSKGD